MSRPLIAVTVGTEDVRHGAWEEPAAILTRLYLDAIQRAGGTGVILAPDDGLAESPDDVLDIVDGLLLTGGVDIDPLAYGAAPHPEIELTAPDRDRFEIALAHRALERDLPLLGICRGAQLMNVATGGTLVQHLPDVLAVDIHRSPTGGAFVDHEVRLAPGSLAARATGEEREAVKSSHHQGIGELGEGLIASGWSIDDEIVEAIELPERRFALGVLWHSEADPSSRVIAALVEEAAERSQRPAPVALPQHRG